MNNKFNYPIKYAVLELKEKGGWLEKYEEITQGFIASKCYVVESDVLYDNEGQSKLVHKVVFPFNDFGKFKQSLSGGIHDIGIANIPAYDFYNNPYPVTVVDQLFEKFEEAKERANEKNEEYKLNLINKVSVNTPGWEIQFELLKQNYDKTVALCNLFEQLAIEKSKDMIITSEKKDEYVKVLKPLRDIRQQEKGE